MNNGQGLDVTFVLWYILEPNFEKQIISDFLFLLFANNFSMSEIPQISPVDVHWGRVRK